MSYRFAADSVLALHLAFILFATFGGWLALQLRWMPLLHLPALAWAVYVELAGQMCPLTSLENDLRVKAGLAGYKESFIEHYLLEVIYPSGLTRDVQFLLAGVLVAINIAAYGWFLYRRRKRVANA
jgi:Protein of Unknown function (DUF2784)